MTVIRGSRRMGLPPRVRSRRPPVQPPTAQGGITSACAEQTRDLSRPNARMRDYLRVCGADVLVAGVLDVFGWITSACAEQTIGRLGECA